MWICNDRPYAARAYNDSFHARVGVREEWRGTDNDRGYVVTDRAYRRGPRLCRDFTQVVYRAGREYDRPRHCLSAPRRRMGIYVAQMSF